jgi:hypothetical protein
MDDPLIGSSPPRRRCRPQDEDVMSTYPASVTEIPNPAMVPPRLRARSEPEPRSQPGPAASTDSDPDATDPGAGDPDTGEPEPEREPPNSG